MDRLEIKSKFKVDKRSECKDDQYAAFLKDAYRLMCDCNNYICYHEDINSLELAHLIPEVPESMLAIYIGINDAVCNKELVTGLLPQHGHNNVFVYDPQVYSGGNDVPTGTADVRAILNGFEPPNETWNKNWTYVMIQGPSRTFASLWKENGYIDMIPAKFEDFTMMTDHNISKLCTFISPKAFEHPVNMNRPYLTAARDRGQQMACEFQIPDLIKNEFYGLEPVVLNEGEKLYVATTDFGPCAHGWCNLHPENQQLAVVNENSAVPLDLVIAKPQVDPKYSKGLIPAKGSADMTTDWFKRGDKIVRMPILQGLLKG